MERIFYCSIFKEASIFLIIIMHLSCELILCPVLRLPLPGWIKTLLYSVISSLGYPFYMPRFFNLASRCRTGFIPVFSQRTILLTHASEQTCAFKTSSEIEGQQAYSRRKARGGGVLSLPHTATSCKCLPWVYHLAGDPFTVLEWSEMSVQYFMSSQVGK